MVKAELNSAGQLSKDTIAYIIANYSNATAYNTNESYFSGNNPTIAATADKESGFPNNRIPVPYGRKIALTTKNYLFSKSPNYIAEDRAYIEALLSVLWINQNDKKIAAAGRSLVVHGSAYKLFYLERVGGEVTPLYAIIPNSDMITVYNYDIEPKMIAAIRYFKKAIDILGNYNTMVEVYYKERIVKYTAPGAATYDNLAPVSDELHGFTAIPVVEYGWDYKQGVFDSVKKLIDAVDVLVSSNMNEIQKFELAYLVLTGQKIKAEDIAKIKERRLFELEPGTTLDYLTKNIDMALHDGVLNFLVSEIHKQSGVPDFASKEFAAESGIALQYKLMGFENLASELEAVFVEGELKSIDIINSILYRQTWKDRVMFWKAQPDTKVDIRMVRNIPEDVANKVAIAEAMRRVGVSMETVLDVIPTIEDVGKEIEKIDAEQAKGFAMFQANQDALTKEPRDTDPDEKPAEDAA